MLPAPIEQVAEITAEGSTDARVPLVADAVRRQPFGNASTYPSSTRTQQQIGMGITDDRLERAEDWNTSDGGALQAGLVVEDPDDVELPKAVQRRENLPCQAARGYEH